MNEPTSPNPAPTSEPDGQTSRAALEGDGSSGQAPLARSQVDGAQVNESDTELPVSEPSEPVAARSVSVATASDHVPEPWLHGSSMRRLRLIDRRLGLGLLLQAVVAVLIGGLWLLGKLSWNHDPLVSQRFRPPELPTLTNRAQNAALEFHHDLVTGEFGQARLLVVEEAEKLVEDAAATCESPAPCASKERVFTRATLLRSVGQDARAFVESFAVDGRLVSKATYELSHSSGRWLVTSRTEP